MWHECGVHFFPNSAAKVSPEQKIYLRNTQQICKKFQLVTWNHVTLQESCLNLVNRIKLFTKTTYFPAPSHQLSGNLVQYSVNTSMCDVKMFPGKLLEMLMPALMPTTSLIWLLRHNDLHSQAPPQHFVAYCVCTVCGIPCLYSMWEQDSLWLRTDLYYILLVGKKNKCLNTHGRHTNCLQTRF